MLFNFIYEPLLLLLEHIGALDCIASMALLNITSKLHSMHAILWTALHFTTAGMQ